MTRLVMLALVTAYPLLRHDVEYYAAQAHERGWSTGLVEYPFPVAVWLMAPAHVLPYAAYLVLFVATALLCDAVATLVLARRMGMAAGWRWTVFVALLGPLAYVRFDLFASFALVIALVEARRHPVRSGLAVAAGVAVKLWPAAFGVGLLGPMRRRARHMLAALASGLAWVALTALVAGPSRVTSPLTWQGERGFECESLWGALLGLERVFGRSVVHLEKRQGSWEYAGELADTWHWLVPLTQDAGYVAILGLLLLGWRAGHDERTATLALTMTAVTSVLVLTSPVLSPQYLLWLLPGLMLVEDVRLRRLACAALVLTQVEMPFVFDGLLTDLWWFSVVFRVVVAVRNVLLVWMAGRAVVLLWRAARGSQPALESSTGE